MRRCIGSRTPLLFLAALFIRHVLESLIADGLLRRLLR